jgi:hypothetical protein
MNVFLFGRVVYNLIPILMLTKQSEKKEEKVALITSASQERV